MSINYSQGSLSSDDFVEVLEINFLNNEFIEINSSFDFEGAILFDDAGVEKSNTLEKIVSGVSDISLIVG